MAERKAARPPSRFEDAFARRATSLEKPNETTLMKWRSAGEPSSATNDTRPTSMGRAGLSRMRRAASPRSSSRSKVRRKSPPVPRGIMPNSEAPPAARIPSATSEMVPSPPMATMRKRPAAASSWAMRRPSPLAWVKRRSAGPSPSVSGPTRAAQLRWLSPRPERGLTITTGRCTGSQVSTKQARHRHAQKHERALRALCVAVPLFALAVLLARG